MAEDEHFSYGKTKGDGTSFSVILFFSRDVFLGHGHVCLADLYPTLPMNVLNWVLISTALMIYIFIVLYREE